MQDYSKVAKGGGQLCSVDASVVFVMGRCWGESLKRKMNAVVKWCWGNVLKRRMIGMTGGDHQELCEGLRAQSCCCV